MRYLVFLDIDGVFTSTRVHLSSHDRNELWNRFDPVAVDFMNRLSDEYQNVEFVVMSTWKNYLNVENKNTNHLVLSMFRNSGFRGKFATPWKTDPFNVLHMNHTQRGAEVTKYLEEFGDDVADYLMFDDNRYDFDRMSKKRLVQTDADNGLQVKHMKNALSIVGTWIPK